MLAGLFKIFGIKISVVVACTLIAFSLTALFIYLIAKELGLSELFSLLCVFLFIADKPEKFMLYSHHWLSTLSALISTYFLLRLIKRESTLMSFASGIFTGITILFFHAKGIPLFAASLFCFLLGTYSYKYNFIKNVSLFITGFLLTLLPIFSYFFFKNAVADLLYHWLVWPFRIYGIVHDYPSFYYPLKLFLYNSYLNDKLLSGIIRALPSLFLGYNFFITLGISAGIFLIERKKQFIMNNITTIVFLLLTSAMFVSTLYRPDDLRLAFISPFILICYVLSLKVFSDYFTGSVPRPRFRSIFFTLAISIPLIISGVNLFVNIGYSMIIFPKLSQKLDTPRGSIYVKKSDEKIRILERVLPILQNENAKSLFVYYCGGEFVYFFWDIKNPIKYDCIIPYHNTEEELEDALMELQSSDVEFIVVVPAVFFLNLQYFPQVQHIDLAKALNEDPIIQYVKSNYIPVMEYGERKIGDEKFYLARLYKRK